MRIVSGLHIDYVVVEFDGTEPDPRTKSGKADIGTKVVHLDDIPREFIDRYIREHSH
jgi:hypothetical protein